MKYLYLFVILLTLALRPVVVHADNKTSYLSEISIRDWEVVKDNREIVLKMVVDLSRLKLRTQHTVALTPVLASRDGSREAAFPPVVIDGKTRNKMYLRAQHLESVELPPYHDNSAQVIIRRNNGKEQVYEYEVSVPYEPWMLDGHVELREQVHGCVNCAKGENDTPLGNVLPAYEPQFRLILIEPEPEPVKMRAETRTARLQFRQDSYNILPKFKNNRAELDSVSHSVEMVKGNADVSITGIYITGYASPEGSVAHNLKLSENRAKALVDYIHRHNDIAADLLHVDWKGEDWEGFRRVLADFPGLLKRDEVYRIIDECQGDRDVCEKQLQDLVPADIYTRLLNEVYPFLRRNEYRIEYNVRNFDLDEARRMLSERPDLLSLHEMYKVAGSYPKDSPEYRRAMEVAGKYYPQLPAVLNDRARAAMNAGRYDEAVALLEKANPTDPRLLNTLGVAYAGMGEPYKARQAFERAASQNCAEAAHNLKEIKNVINQL